MEDIFTSSLPSGHHFNGMNLDARDYGQSELDAMGGVAPRRSSHRHHANSGGGGTSSYDRSIRLQGENDYLKERVRNFEKGMGKIYQVRYIDVDVVSSVILEHETLKRP